MSESIKVSVTGCSGRMGRAAVAAINSDPELDLVSGVDVIELGSDIGELAGLDPLGITVSEDLASTLKKSGAHVAVDFTHPSVVLDNVKITIQSGVSPVVGTTGWNDDMLASIQELCNAKNVPAFICPNFAIGAVLMTKKVASGMIPGSHRTRQGDPVTRRVSGPSSQNPDSSPACGSCGAG